MPLWTPLRILLLILLTWTGPLIFWCFLPFPQHARDPYVEHKLTSGQQIISVIDSENYYGGSAVEWQLTETQSSEGYSIYVHIGAHAVNLSEVIRHELGYQSKIIRSAVISGAQPEDNYIAMPWFAYADAVMSQLKPFYYMDIGLRATLEQNRVVKIWSDPSYMNEEQLHHGFDPHFPGVDRQYGLLIAMSNIPTSCNTPSCLEQIRVEYLSGSLPSRTYPIRRWLLDHCETQIFINLYIVTLFVHPRQMLEMSYFLILPLAVVYSILGLFLCRVLFRLRARMVIPTLSELKKEDV